MCLETPAQVVSVDPDGLCATVTGEHGNQPALLLALDLSAQPVEPGDWLLVHSGLAVQRMSEEEALDLLEFVGHARSARDFQ
jgi:hydrogenase expression/formation protein HypC